MPFIRGNNGPVIALINKSVVIKQKMKINISGKTIIITAVSNYHPIKTFPDKIKSNWKGLTIKLKPAIKIVDRIKKFGPSIFQSSSSWKLINRMLNKYCL